MPTMAGKKTRVRHSTRIVRSGAFHSDDRLASQVGEPSEPSPAWRLEYTIDARTARSDKGLVLHVAERRRFEKGRIEIRAFIPAGFNSRGRDDLIEQIDRRIADVLPGGRRALLYSRATGEENGRFVLDRAQCEIVIPLLCESTRCSLWAAQREPIAISAEGGEPWLLGARVARDEQRGECRLEGFLARGEERIGLGEPELLLSAGFFTSGDRIARFDARGAPTWAVTRWRDGPLCVPLEREEELFDELGRIPGKPLIEIDAVGEQAPTPWLYIDGRRDEGGSLACRIVYHYEGVEVAAADRRRILFDPIRRRAWRRQPAEELEARSQFLAQGGSAREIAAGREAFELDPEHLAATVRALLESGWVVEARGKRVHRSSGASYSLRSGIDWFELSGGVDFDGQQASIASLSRCVSSGEQLVRLDDGSLGVLPEDWLASWGLVARLGAVAEDGLRFDRGQALLLDKLVMRGAELKLDAKFKGLREKLAGFERIEPRREPRSFRGTLREYQRQALGWLAFLRQFGLGGCLADEMGLGKTIVVLACLEQRRLSREKDRRPSLIVVPRSIVTNWTREAERFAPKLVLRRYTGAGREAELDRLAPGELLITTYGTLRRDVELLAAVEFDYVVLDEAQAIKNASSHTARAARSLCARHRLALSGTPVENHLGELGSLLSFLGPQLLGSKRILSLLDARAESPAAHEQQAKLLRALRPLILRRTKREVLPELPEKIEQILWCELQAEQARVYDGLREDLRRSLLAPSDDSASGRWKLNALEALLRLRQAACHPALIDREFADCGSAKLERLFLHLEEIRENGHKALVFSQFTRFLALVREGLDERSIPYAYLDGRTRRRSERVERFQTDPDCTAFLISLKAGGVGLNLTAADYVFLLDPWWNPAVEAQAIDRAHRMGRTGKVMAYRLIARDTIEEKVLQLQEKKRALAASVLGESGGLMRQLTREDLEELLS